MWDAVMLETASSDIVAGLVPNGKGPGHGVDHPPPSIARVCMGKLYLLLCYGM
jgi:hypothetical protein